MKILSSDKFQDLQQSFHKVFPHLKIKFYASSHEENHGSPASEQVDSNMNLIDFNPDIESGSVRLSDQLTVKDFEDQIKSRFGLNVQVFRQSGSLWLQTSTTDHWTLATQNRKGEHSAQLVRKESIQDADELDL